MLFQFLKGHVAFQYCVGAQLKKREKWRAPWDVIGFCNLPDQHSHWIHDYQFILGDCIPRGMGNKISSVLRIPGMDTPVYHTDYVKMSNSPHRALHVAASLLPPFWLLLRRNFSFLRFESVPFLEFAFAHRQHVSILPPLPVPLLLCPFGVDVVAPWNIKGWSRLRTLDVTWNFLDLTIGRRRNRAEFISLNRTRCFYVHPNKCPIWPRNFSKITHQSKWYALGRRDVILLRLCCAESPRAVYLDFLTWRRQLQCETHRRRRKLTKNCEFICKNGPSSYSLRSRENSTSFGSEPSLT